MYNITATRIHVIQCDAGRNQGSMNERGFVFREIHSVQLLESFTSIVSATPKIRMGKFVEICGVLREARWQTPPNEKWSDQRSYWKVTLHGDDELPTDLVEPGPEVRTRY